MDKELIKNKFNIEEYVVGIHPLYNLISAKIINIIPINGRYVYEVIFKWDGSYKKIKVQEEVLSKHK